MDGEGIDHIYGLVSNRLVPSFLLFRGTRGSGSRIQIPCKGSERGGREKEDGEKAYDISNRSNDRGMAAGFGIASQVIGGEACGEEFPAAIPAAGQVASSHAGYKEELKHEIGYRFLISIYLCIPESLDSVVKNGINKLSLRAMR